MKHQVTVFLPCSSRSFPSSAVKSGLRLKAISLVSLWSSSIVSRDLNGWPACVPPSVCLRRSVCPSLCHPGSCLSLWKNKAGETTVTHGSETGCCGSGPLSLSCASFTSLTSNHAWNMPLPPSVCRSTQKRLWRKGAGAGWSAEIPTVDLVQYPGVNGVSMDSMECSSVVLTVTHHLIK